MALVKPGIKSFVLRQGRMSKGQKNALLTLSDEFFADLTPTQLDFDVLFGRQGKTVVEIGFGMGQSLVEMAFSHPDVNFLGIEVHKPGVGHLLLEASKKALSNLKVINEDAVSVMSNKIPDNSLWGINIFFPDPWPKKKHHKRRLIQHEWVALLCQKIEVGGYIHLATDWAPYAEHMEEVMSNFSSLEKSEAMIKRPPTRFEARGQRLGHSINDYVYVRKV